MRRDDHDELRGLMGPYVLGALAADDVAALRAHLLECEDCRAEADALVAVGSSLVLAVAPEPLPAGFSERVLAIARAEGPLERAPARARRWSLGVLAYGALVIAVAVLGAALVDSRQDRDREQKVLRAVLAGEGMALSGRGGAVGRMVPTPTGGLLAVSGLKSAPEGHTFELWLVPSRCAGSPCEPEPAGTFDTSGGSALHETERSLHGVKGVAVTLEPAGGSSRPTTEPVLAST